MTFEIIYPAALPTSATPAPAAVQPTPPTKAATRCTQCATRPAQGHFRHNGRAACLPCLIAAGTAAAGAPQ